MKNISIWKDTVETRVYPKLDSDKSVDVLIVGGGITGVSALYHLRNSNLNVMLVEQNRVGFSVTGSSTGKLNYLQNDLLDKIRKNFSDKVASKYLQSQKTAIEMVTDIISKEKIDCDLEKVSANLYTNKDIEIEKLKDLKLFLEDNNISVFEDNSDLVHSKYMIKVEDTYLFHPIKFVYGLLKKNDFPIYENTSVQKIEEENDYYICYTDQYKIKAKWVVLASHYPYFVLPFLFPIKASLEKSYLSASKYGGKSVSLISYSNPFISIRNYKDYLIYLSNSHSVDSSVNDFHHFNELSKKIGDLDLEAEYLWSNIDVMTNDGLPYIGRMKGNILIGTGYNTWGLANGVLAGSILSDVILNRKNSFLELFSPTRMNASKIAGGIVDGIKSINGYINGLLKKSSNIRYEVRDGKSVMIYYDGKKEYVVYQNCPHFGCKLLFNEVEKTWDCPCHGSRFDLSGKCISGPSNKDITFIDGKDFN